MYRVSIIHGFIDFPNAPVSFRDNPHELRNVNPYTVSGIGAKTNSFMYSFYLSAAAVSNSLPFELVHSTYHSFKL